jgi:Abnormal spindle-like microcephaly-assoc'd, ASPM-SPD-2-Hydin
MFRVGTVVRTLILCGLALTTLAFAKTNKNTTIVTYPSGFAVSQPVSDLPINQLLLQGKEEHEPGPGPLRFKTQTAPWLQEDPVLQKEVLPQVSATPGINFDGIPSPGFAPSDSNMAVGPNQIVETVNVQFAVYSKSGATLAGPTDIQALFAPLGGVCASTFGDPVVLYDRPADRWLISFIGSNAGGSIGAECVAVSKTNDPAGAYFLYGYSFGVNLNDYPKLGVWATTSNSAYLATYNIFKNFQNFGGADLCAFDRTKMLAGDSSAAQLCQMTPASEFGYLPSDMDGPTPPVDGTPGLFITWQNNNPGQLFLRKLTLNFAGGTATLSSPTTISVANTNLACGNGGTCVPQSGTTQTLDTLGDRMMYRFAIRHFSDHDRAVVNHSVGSGSQVAVRWYELYDPAGSVTVNQQGTFAPDTTYRWMASMAEDQNGDIGLGYSASSSTIHPGIRFTGRVPSDPSGTMETEANVVTGAGSQTTGLSRWGDYTAMVVDPSDDCTFWYVDQYEQTSGTFNWHTNISSFAFPGCGGGGGGGPVVSLTPASLKWGNVVLGATGGVKTITVKNTGTATLSISKIAISGDFALTTAPKPCGSTLDVGKTCQIKVTFTPTQVGARTGTVTITDNAADSPQSVPLSGTGAVQATLTPATKAFPTETVGTASPAKVFTLTNKQSVSLTGISSSTTGDFTISATTCSATLAAKAKCTISVVFKPTAKGARTGTLTVADSASGSPQTASLTGTGK